MGGPYKLGAKEYKRQYYQKNKKKILARRKERYEENKDANHAQVYQWRKDNPGKVNGWTANRRAGMKNRTPSWADLRAISLIYENCPEGHHVDHIYPLNGKDISGLHVENNLQYITISENCSKGNKWI